VKLKNFLMMALLSGSANATGTIELFHTVDGTLGANATPATTNAMLVSAMWRYLNPDKEHSTWESMTFVFDPSGTVEVTWWGPMQHVDKRPWHVLTAGSAPTVDIGGVVYRMAPCSHAPRTTCLVGPRP
jgi:hypothetical protein